MRRKFGLGLACAAGVAVNLLILGPGALKLALHGQGDFQAAYTGAAIPHTPFDPEAIARVQTERFGKPNDQLLPIRLPFWFAMLSPMARLDYPRAHLVWTVGMTLAAVAFAWLVPADQRSNAALACCWSLPLVTAIVIGQDLPLLLAILAAALRLRDAGRPFAAGCVLALCLIKFHLFVLLPLPFLRGREWRLMGGWAAGVLVLVAASFLAAGTGWPRDYLALIVREGNVNAGAQWAMPTLHGIAAHFRWGLMVEAALSLAAIGLAIRAVQRNSFEVGFAASLAGGYLIARHAYMQDCSILLPALLILARPGGFAKEAAHILAIALLFPVIYAFLFVEQVWIIAAGIAMLLAALALGPAGAAPAGHPAAG